MDKDNPEKALEFWKKAIEKDPYLTASYLNIGNFYLINGDYANSMIYLKKLVSFNPDMASASASLGTVYERQNKIEDAVIEYNKALKIDPGNLEERYNLANIYGRLKNPLALEHFKMLVRDHPDYGPGHYGLGVSYLIFRPDRIDMVREHLETAQKLGYAVPEELLKKVR